MPVTPTETWSGDQHYHDAMTSEQIAGIVAERRAAFDAGITKPLAWRRQQLHGIRRMLTEHTADFEAALASDLHRSPTETQLADINVILAEVSHALKHLLQDTAMPPWQRDRLPLLSAPDGTLLATGDTLLAAPLAQWLAARDARLAWTRLA